MHLRLSINDQTIEIGMGYTLCIHAFENRKLQPLTLGRLGMNEENTCRGTVDTEDTEQEKEEEEEKEERS